MTTNKTLTASEILKELNELLDTVGKPPLKHPTSKADMLRRIEELKTATRHDEVEDDGDMILLAELCAQLKVKPRAARIKLRAAGNNLAYTRYAWPRSNKEMIAHVTAIILGKKEK